MNRSRLLTLLLASVVALLLIPSAASAAFGPLEGINTIGGGPTDTTYQLDYPGSVVRVPDGPSYSFFVTDSANNRVVKLDADGKFLSSFGGQTGGATQMFGPRSITYGGGFLYVATNGYNIRKYTLSGDLVTEWGGYSATPVDGKFNNIGGIAYDPAWGQIYAADVQNHRIQWFDIDGTFRGKMGTQGSGSGQLFFPRDLAFGDGGQRLFVLDSGNNRVQYFNRQGSNPNFTFDYVGSFGNSNPSDAAGLTDSQSVTVDRSTLTGHGDRIYVTLGGTSNKIKVFEGDTSSAPPFTPTFTWGQTGSAVGEFNSPSDVFIEGTTAYVADGANNRVSSFTGLPTSATPAAQWGKNPAVDGYLQSGSRAASGPDGSIYAVDAIKTRVQRFAASGALLAAWGTVGTGDGQFASGGISGLAVEPNGNVLVSDSTERRVQRFGPNGAFIETIEWTPISPATTIMPGPLRTDAAGDIYVFDYDAFKVVELTSSGTIVSSFGESGLSDVGNQIYSLFDLVVSPNGDTVYIMDYVRLKKFTRSGGTWGGHPASQNHLGSGTGPLQFGNPFSIALDPTTGDILVADSANNRVQRVHEAGDAYTHLVTYGSVAGGFGELEFVRPNGVTVDQWGNMSVIDSGSDSIKRYGDAPTVTIDSPLTGMTTTAASVPVSFTSTDPAADCDVTNGSSVALSLGSNPIVINCTNDQGAGSASVTVHRGEAPVISITAPTDSSSTTASTTPVTWTTTGTEPIACSLNGALETSPATADLVLGANTFTVACTSDYGSDTKVVTVTRTVPVVVAPPAGPAPPSGTPSDVASVSLKLPKKLKLSKSRKLKFSVTCPDGCTVTPKLTFGKKSSRIKAVRKAANAAPQTVTITLSKTMSAKAKAWMVNNRSVYLNVTVQSYKATQGKTGKAKLSK